MGEFRVLVGGQSPQWRESLAAAFSENSVFEVVGSAATMELIDTAVRFRPDVVLWKLDDEDPVPVAAELKQRCPFTLAVVMVEDPNNYNLVELVRAGIRGCLPLRLMPRQIVQAVELIAKAGMLCLPRLGADFLNNNHRKGAPIVPSLLTGREREILALLGKNLSNQEIGQALYLSESTVKTHLRSIFRKLEVRNRAEAVVTALRLGLVEQS
jgi:DNA-binding NarL/FixJ family response regulator